jgi:hypothetical protein
MVITGIDRMTYTEIVAAKLPKGLSTEGRCEELFEKAWQISLAEFGKKQTVWLFQYDEDFQNELVTEYLRA